MFSISIAPLRHLCSTALVLCSFARSRSWAFIDSSWVASSASLISSYQESSEHQAHICVDVSQVMPELIARFSKVR